MRQNARPLVHTKWRSNLVFASDGRRVFGVDAEGALGSVIVPRDPMDRPVPMRLERASSPGAIVAVGWLEDRLATVTLSGSDLELSHGTYGLNLGASGSLRVPLREAGISIEAGRRLEPYGRWWQEVNPQEGFFGGISLVRDVDGALHAVAGWSEEGTHKWTVSRVAERVTSFAARDEERMALFVGEVARPGPRGENVHGIYALSRRLGGGAELVCRLDGRGPVRAFVASRGAERGTLVAVEIFPGTWSFFGVDATLACHRLPDAASVAHGDVLGALADSPALVVRDDAKTALSLVRAEETVLLASSPSPIAEAAVSPVARLVAYLSTDGDLAFAWAGET